MDKVNLRPLDRATQPIYNNTTTNKIYIQKCMYIFIERERETHTHNTNINNINTNHNIHTKYGYIYI